MLIGACAKPLQRSAILPDMQKTRTPNKIVQGAKPRVAFVGAGNLAAAMAVALRSAGYEIAQIVTRDGAGSLRRARALARSLQTSASSLKQTNIDADLVWFCVPDSAIARAAKSLAEACDWKGKIALHSSGALTSDELAKLRVRGAAVASVHPLMTFVRRSKPALKGISFATEGDARAVHVAQQMVADLEGEVFAIRKRDKAAYHTWSMFLSPLLTALLAAGEHVAAKAGVPRRAARQRMLPILGQTIANYAAMGARQAFSGPIARGDTATVEKHLKILQSIPNVRDVYVALARSASRDLPGKNRKSLARTLGKKL